MSETQNDCQPSTSGSGGSGGPSKNVEKNVAAVEECNKSEEGEETGAVTMLDVLQVSCPVKGLSVAVRQGTF